MSELSKSTNPRVRRSYAHVMLGKLANGEVNSADAQDAISRADQTRKGRASNFGRAMVKARERGAEKMLREAREAHDEAMRTRPTIDYDVEIITSVPLPDGSLLPIVIGASSGEEFDRAHEESEEIARGPGGVEAATAHMLRSMAQAGGLESQLALYRGVELGRLAERSQMAEPAVGPPA